jgi:hypothetical protein
MRVWRVGGAVRALRSFATRFSVAPPGSALESAGRVVERHPAHGFEVIELDAPLPRLYRPLSVRRASGEEMLAGLDGDASLLTVAVATIDAPPGEHGAATGSVLTFDDVGERQRWIVAHDAPGYWVIADALDDDWVASVDGSPASFVRADLMHRAVWLPSGRHEVLLAHRPFALLTLFGLSLAVLGALAALAGVVRIGRGATLPP